MSFETSYEECVKCNHRRHMELFKENSVVCTPCQEYIKPKKEEEDVNNVS